jgi:hypothetical protein
VDVGFGLVGHGGDLTRVAWAASIRFLASRRFSRFW